MKQDTPIYAELEWMIFQKLKTLGFNPAIVADIGASNGCWSDQMASVFPNAEYHFFVPCAELLEQYRAPLKHVLAHRGNFRLHPVALPSGSRTNGID